MSNVLQIESLSAGYGPIDVLRDVHLHVNKGEIVTIIGSNGAGKSTLLKTISGLMGAKQGDIQFLGTSIKKAKTHEIVSRGLIHVPEGREILKRMSIQDNLLMGAMYRTKEEIKEDLQSCFQRFPILEERKHELAGTLSGGQQQMVAIARGLMARPTLLMLDEPSLGLAPMVVRDIFNTIKLLKSRGITVLLVEQNAKQALRIADRAYVLERGTITLSGTGVELLHNPEIMKAYLGEVS